VQVNRNIDQTSKLARSAAPAAKGCDESPLSGKLLYARIEYVSHKNVASSIKDNTPETRS
jgi:hypothetical protein